MTTEKDVQMTPEAVDAADGCAEPALKRPKIDKPRKANFRQRAHCNPLSDSLIVYPKTPEHVDWSIHYPHFFPHVKEPLAVPVQVNTSNHPLSYSDEPVAAAVNGSEGRYPEFLDIGCGFGGLTVALSEMFPDKLTMGMEIRTQVTDYVGLRIQALREQDGTHKNCAVIRTNCMKFMVNYFRKASIEKMFFCFADPHFKRKNHRRRIINHGLLSLYAYVLKPGAILYAITDVKELYEWQHAALQGHPLFEEIPEEEYAKDPCVEAIRTKTEEGLKVIRNNKPMYPSIFRRKADPEK